MNKSRRILSLLEVKKPGHVKTIWDNGGETFDRYVVIMKDRSALGLSDNPDSPQGFSQWSEITEGPHLGKKIVWDDLPKDVQDHVVRRLGLMEAKDQYGKPLPKDLVVLEADPADFDEEQLERLAGIDWWDINGIICVSFEQAEHVVPGMVGEINPADAGIDLKDPDIEVYRIDHALKRWSEEDGFYHA